MCRALSGEGGVLPLMTTAHHLEVDTKLLLRGIHVGLDTTAKAFIETKARRLFRHEPRIIRLRIDVERDARSRRPMFTAKGRVELAGPDLTASVATEAASTSISLLIDKLDRMLRKRTAALMRHRTTDDIRAHAATAFA